MAGSVSMDESEDDVEMSLYPPGEFFLGTLEPLNFVPLEVPDSCRSRLLS